MRGALLRRPAEVVRSTLALLAGAAGAVVVAVSISDLAQTPGGVGAAVLEATIASSVFVLSGALMPVGDGLDPRSFRQHGLTASTVGIGTLLGGLLSVPVLLYACFSIAVAVSVGAAAGPVLTTLATISAILTGAVALRFTQARLRSARHVAGRQRTRFAAALAIVVLTLLEGVLVLGGEAAAAAGGLAASSTAWFPLQWPWAALSAGPDGALPLALAFALLALLVAGWLVLTVRLLRATRDAAPVEDGLGWFAALPANPVGAVAARTFVYWARDARYRASLSVLPVVPALAMVPLIVAGAPASAVALTPVLVFALLLGWLPHNDVAYDHSAFWLHVSSAAPGWADRLGRVIPAIVLGVPVIVLASFVAALFATGDDLVAATIGTALALLLAGLGASSVSSALRPYPAVPPGGSPFRQPQSVGGTGLWPQLLGFVVAIAAAWLPGALLFESAAAVPGAGMAAFWSGLGIGAAVLTAGVLIGGRVYDRRAPELLFIVQQV